MRKKWKRIILGSIIVLAAVVCFTIWRAYQTYDQLDQMSKPEDQSRFQQIELSPEYEPPEWTGTERVNVLLLGGDERGLREGEVAHSDTMMVVSFDPPTKRIHLLSVLRDTYVDIPGHRKGRINTAMMLGRPELAMKTVGELLELDIQYYVYVDFQGFIKLVDALGGIDFYVEKDMKYSDSADGNQFDIDLKEGYQHLDGEKALQYVRFRHDALSDYTRTERQRNFMKAVADKMQTAWNLIRLPDVLASFTPYVETNMSPQDMLKLASLGYKSHQAGSAQIPPMELVSEERINGQSVIVIKDMDSLRKFVRETLESDITLEQPPTSSPSASPSASAGS